ncbi:PREDICTED: uncharacterized protein LOC104810925 [Tarenaya hassleriana]|uniref:uncharacterized protein LOC104810925 n=1 Tax=Tarenaya hassleriana TaxID=28532 RepID=UPI00053C4F3A|nr:PREDICTED: uncharacterized protein LOC104810925 [Tarenaya hassleriana]
METASISAAVFFSGAAVTPPFRRISLSRRPVHRNFRPLSAFNTTARAGSEIVEEDVLQMFLKDREANGDFISRVSDKLWLKEFLKYVDDDSSGASATAELDEQETTISSADDGDGGFLKLKQTQEWIIGEKISAPINKKAMAKALRDDSERRKKLNILQYEALKRELTLLSIGIGIGCSGYCLLALSIQAAISYAVGVLFSCLYLQLLYRYTDVVSREMVPDIFLKKKSKKIGIRSEDLQNFIERTIKGSGLALSSPRLVLPAAIYALWALSHKYYQNDFLDFQIVPAMLGMFVYKAAALVQVYRDNQDLQFVFPENEEPPRN